MNLERPPMIMGAVEFYDPNGMLVAVVELVDRNRIYRLLNEPSLMPVISFQAA